MASEHLAQRAGQLQAERVYWESMRRNAYFQLEQLQPTEGMYTDNVQEQLKSQLSMALFHLEEIAQELNSIREQQEAEARETAQREQEAREKETSQREDQLKEQLAVEDREKAEAFQKEEQLKADAFEKERQEKEFFEKKESERLEALAKEERE